MPAQLERWFDGKPVPKKTLWVIIVHDLDGPAHVHGPFQSRADADWYAGEKVFGLYDAVPMSLPEVA